MTYLYIALGVIGALLLVSLVLGILVTARIFHPRHFTWEQGKDHERNMGAWVEDEFEGLMAVGRVQRFSVTAFDGVQLTAAWVLPEDESGDKAVVIMHGFGDCAVNSYKYAKLFLERGYAALIYDNRNAGESGGSITTMGFWERRDLAQMVEIAREYAGVKGIVGTHGESMGGATVIMEACREGGVDFVVSDCPFMDMRTEVSDTLRAMHLPRFPLVGVGSLVCKAIAGFHFKEVSPIADLKAANGLPDVPMLMIHGTADTFIPPVSAEKLYEAKAGQKRLWLCEGAAHARSIVKDNARYRQELSSFLDGCGY